MGGARRRSCEHRCQLCVVHVDRSVKGGVKMSDSCTNVADVSIVRKVGLEKYPRQESRSIQYGTAGFRTR
jgi:hypothetical protein